MTIKMINRWAVVSTLLLLLLMHRLKAVVAN